MGTSSFVLSFHKEALSSKSEVSRAAFSLHANECVHVHDEWPAPGISPNPPLLWPQLSCTKNRSPLWYCAQFTHVELIQQEIPKLLAGMNLLRLEWVVWRQIPGFYHGSFPRHFGLELRQQGLQG